jgi:hypothetical protein
MSYIQSFVQDVFEVLVWVVYLSVCVLCVTLQSLWYKVVHFNKVEKMSVQIWLEANLWAINVCLMILTVLTNFN